MIFGKDSCRYSRPRWTASPIRPDMIFGKDSLRARDGRMVDCDEREKNNQYCSSRAEQQPAEKMMDDGFGDVTQLHRQDSLAPRHAKNKTNAGSDDQHGQRPLLNFICDLLDRIAT
jgi:hypothetical protein